MSTVVPGGRLDLAGAVLVAGGSAAEVTVHDLDAVAGPDAAGVLAGHLAAAGAGAAPLAEALSRSGFAARSCVHVTSGPATADDAAAPGSWDVTGEHPATVVLRLTAQGTPSWHLPSAPALVPLPPPTTGDTLVVLAPGRARVVPLLVAAWEAAFRPTAVRPVTAQGVPDDAVLDADGWRRLASGPALLLVHGAFSTARSTFADLAGTPLAGLAGAYDGRLAALDHPSLSVDPYATARALAAAVPAGLSLEVDVLSHSRGGLVGRALVDVARPTVTVRRHVHVATPNAGTVLAAPQRWGDLADVLTALAVDDAPEGADAGTAAGPADLLDGVLALVEHLAGAVAAGVVEPLPGLAALEPGSAVLDRLRAAGEAGRSAREQAVVVADVEPDGGPLAALDDVVDRFFGEPNDLVVPTAGAAALPGLPAGATLVLPRVPVVTHTGYFRDPSVRAELARRLG